LAGLHVGGINALMQKYELGPLVGTSAGAIVAACAASGMSGPDMTDVVLSADYGRLIPYNPVLAPFRGYLASNKNVRAWLRDLTKGQWLGDTQIHVTLITSDLQGSTVQTFSTTSHPDMPLADAVLASMSIPDVFPMFAGRYVDGGLMCNLGVNYLPKTGNRVALRVVEAASVGPITGFIDEQEQLVSAALSATEWTDAQLAKSLGVPVVKLPGGNVGFLNRSMTRTQKSQLYQAGFLAVRDWMEQPDE
jgi:predicted acylesterase/phospholipase RssA